MFFLLEKYGTYVIAYLFGEWSKQTLLISKTSTQSRIWPIRYVIGVYQSGKWDKKRVIWIKT